MHTKRFRDLLVWQKSFALAKKIYDVTLTFPREERFGLTSQLRRAATSVPSNISEGYGRLTRGEYLNQLSVASGSLNEVLTQLLLAGEYGFVGQGNLAALEALVDEVSRMLWAMIRGLRETHKAPRRSEGPGS
jgi:four helix bundle protein